MSIDAIFNRGLDGLTVAQRGMATTANNLSNLNTEGYARQEVRVTWRTSTGAGGLGGAVVQGIDTIVNPFVELQLFNASNDFGTLDGRRRVVSQLESVWDSAADHGLGPAITQYFKAWNNLSGDASSTSFRQSVRDRGSELTERFRSMVTQLNDMRRSLSSEIDSRVDIINSYAEDIAGINNQIINAADATSISDLKNQRTLMMRKLAEEIDVTYYEEENGALAVQLPGGLPLIAGVQSGTFSMTDNLGAGGDVTINYTPIDGSTNFDMTAQMTRGRLGGNLIDRNTTINAQIDQLDTLAYQIVTQVNALHVTGYGLDGADGRNFFQPLASSTGAASTIAVDALILADTDAIAAASQAPGTSGVGDNRMALQIVDLQNSLTMNGSTQSFSQYFQGIVGENGILAATVERQYNNLNSLKSQLEVQRESVSGVNENEEAANLLRYQRAYQAASKLLQIANELSRTLLEL